MGHEERYVHLPASSRRNIVAKVTQTYSLSPTPVPLFRPEGARQDIRLCTELQGVPCPQDRTCHSCARYTLAEPTSTCSNHLRARRWSGRRPATRACCSASRFCNSL